MEKTGNFIIRIYGIVVNEKKEILLSDEFQLGMKMTKFPGGGLHFGEGTIDCLKREFSEECNGQKISNIKHFYTTDFYQQAMFYENHQLISIYYWIDLIKPIRFRISTNPFDFEKMENGNQSFRWASIKNTSKAELTFPVDKIVFQKLKNS